MLLVGWAYYKQHDIKTALIQVALLLIVILIGVVLGKHVQNSVSEAQKHLTSNQNDEIVVRVNSYPSENNSSYRYEAKVSSENYSSAYVYLSSKERFEYGQKLKIRGTFKPFSQDNKGYLIQRGIVGQYKVLNSEVIKQPGYLRQFLNKTHSYLIERIDPKSSKSRALLVAFVMGDKSYAKAQKITQSFTNAGLAHILAVSGAHLVVLMYLIEHILLKFRLMSSMRTLILSITSGLFVLLCSAPISAIRAWVMYTSIAITRLQGRRMSPLIALSLFVCFDLLFNPLNAVNIGFCYSVIAVGSLTMFATPTNSWIVNKLNILIDDLPIYRYTSKKILYKMRGVVSILTASIVVMIATAPLSIGVFGVIHPLGFISNIVVAPLFAPYIQIAFICLVVLGVPYVSNVALFICDMFGSIFIWIVELLSQIKFMTVPIDLSHAWIIIGCFFLIFIAIKKKGISRYLCIGLVVFVVGYGCVVRVGWMLWAPARIIVMDVGQGDSIVLQEGSTTILVDAGPPNQLVDALRRNHIYSLDAIFITHLDLDHYAGVIELPGNIECSHVYVAQGAKDNLPEPLKKSVIELTGVEVSEVKPMTSYKIGNYSFRFLWPQDTVDGLDNEDSLCMLMSYQQKKPFKMLLTGDLESDQMIQILSSIPVKADILKVGHHGSKKSVDEQTLNIIKPSDAIISCGRNNDYGHPSPTCLKQLDKQKVNTYVTASMGDVFIYPTDTGYKISPKKDMEMDSPRRAA